MKLTTMIFRTKPETKMMCSVCGRKLKRGSIYRSKNNGKCCESCYFAANPPREETTITERLRQQRIDDGYRFRSYEQLSRKEVKKAASPLCDPKIRAEWRACPPPPFPNLVKPRTRQELVEQSKSFYSTHFSREEREKFETYRDNMLRILDRPLWDLQQKAKARQKAENIKAIQEAEKLNKKSMVAHEKRCKQEAAENRKEWIAHLEPFVRKHAKTGECAELIYTYIRDIVQLTDNPCFGKFTLITEDSIECTHNWFACSFFDDGGSESEECKFHLWYAGDEEKEQVSASRIKNQEPYNKHCYTHSIHDLFFCEDPLGLSGVYGFRFDYEHESERPSYSE